MNDTPFPAAFLEKLTCMVPEEKLPSVMQAFEQKPLPSLRANILKTTPVDLREHLRALGFVLQEMPWYQHAFFLKNKSIQELTDTSWYREGHLYIQNASSMIPALALDPQPSDRVLDLTAAPGSKTTQMAMLMHNGGEIVANDLSQARLFTLRRHLKEQGITNTRTTHLPGETVWKRYPEYFDKTLVDVPCSMEGRFCQQDPQTYQGWSPRKVKQLAVRQRYLLRSAVSATREGGVIVYSTCTLSPEENEEVIDWILTKESGALEVEAISIGRLDMQPGLLAWKKAFDAQVKHTARILPSQTMEGFFIARLRKLRPTALL